MVAYSVKFAYDTRKTSCNVAGFEAYSGGRGGDTSMSEDKTMSELETARENVRRCAHMVKLASATLPRYTRERHQIILTNFEELYGTMPKLELMYHRNVLATNRSETPACIVIQGIHMEALSRLILKAVEREEKVLGQGDH